MTNERTRKMAAHTLSNGVAAGGCVKIVPSSSSNVVNQLPFFSSISFNNICAIASTIFVILPDCIICGPTFPSKRNSFSRDSLIKSVSANSPWRIDSFLWPSSFDLTPSSSRLLQIATKTSLRTLNGCNAFDPVTPVTTNSTVFNIRTLRFSSSKVGNASIYSVRMFVCSSTSV